MASLVDRIVGTDGDKIAIHAFTGAINEFRRGKTTSFVITAGNP
jgi:hypothetical protein